MSSTVKKKEASHDEGGISLFPFLAVLLCTMGALLVLLVVLSHQAHERRRAEIALAAAELAENTKNELENKDREITIDRTNSESEEPTLDESPSGPDREELNRQIAVQTESLNRSRTQLAQLQRELDQLDQQLAAIPIPVPDSSSDTPSRSDSEFVTGAKSIATQSATELEGLRSESNQLWTQLQESQIVREQLRTQIAQEEQSLADLRVQLTNLATTSIKTNSGIPQADRIASTAQELSDQEPVWSVVPYAGPNGVRKRPIYLECRRDGIVLQPDGIRFTKRDFVENSSILENPFLVAVQIAEASSNAPTPNGTPAALPYLLLLVRPDGIASYYVARTALEGHTAQFGYELLGADWKLTCPPSNPQVTATIQTAVAQARERLYRQQMIAAIEASDDLATIDPTTLLAASESGSTTNAGAQVASSSDTSSGTGNSMEAKSVAQNENSKEVGRFDYDEDNTDIIGGNKTGTIKKDQVFTVSGLGIEDGGTRMIGGFAGIDSVVANNDFSKNGCSTQENRFAGTIPNTPNGGFAQTGSVAETSGTGVTSLTNEGSANQIAATSTSASTSASQRVIVPESSGKSNGPGEFDSLVFGDPGRGDKDMPQEGQDGTMGSSDSDSRSYSRSSGRTSSDGSQEESMGAAATNLFSLASTRGKNWGVPDAVRTMSPVERPIRVQLTTNRLTLPRNPETRRIPEITFTGPMTAAMDDLVTVVWEHQRSWGFAGRQMYWRPVLNVEIAPDAQSQFQELCDLMKDSGIEIRQATNGSRSR